MRNILIIFIFNSLLVLMQNMMSALPPTQLPFSCGGSNSLFCESMSFDPQLVYAQVIAEARIYAQSLNSLEQSTPPPPPKGKVRSTTSRDQFDHHLRHRSRSVRVAPQDFCFSPDLQSSLEDLKAARKSWKVSLLFWRRYKKNKSPSSSNSSKSRSSRRSTCSSYSAPVVYTDHGDDDRGDEMKIPSTPFRWNKPTSWAYRAAGALSPGGGHKISEVHFPYVPLSHSTGHSRFAPHEAAGQPMMYLAA